MAEGPAAHGAADAAYHPELACIPLRECKGTWKLLVAKPATAGAEPVARGLDTAPGYDIAPGVQRMQDVPFSHLSEVLYVFGAPQGTPKKRGVVWGAVMHERKGVPLLAVGSKDGSGVELISANAAELAPAEQRRLGAAWGTETAYREALHLAAQAIDKLVVDMASRRTLVTKPEPVVEHLTKPELVEEARYHGYVLVTPSEQEKQKAELENWKEIAASKEHDMAVLKASLRREKRQREPSDGAETPRQAVATPLDQLEWEMLQVIAKKLDEVLVTQQKNSKRVKKIKKEMKYNRRF